MSDSGRESRPFAAYSTEELYQFHKDIQERLDERRTGIDRELLQANRERVELLESAIRAHQTHKNDVSLYVLLPEGYQVFRHDSASNQIAALQAEIQGLRERLRIYEV